MQSEATRYVDFYVNNNVQILYSTLLCPNANEIFRETPNSQFYSDVYAFTNQLHDALRKYYDVEALAQIDGCKKFTLRKNLT